MREADLDQVMVIETENFSLPWSRKSFQDMMARPEAIFLVAEQRSEGPGETAGEGGPGEESRILGYAGAVTAMDQGDVTNIAVPDEYKKKGIATVLLKDLIRETMLAGVTELFLEVREHNTPALCLYRAAGFEEVGRRKGYYDKPKEDALLMKKEIDPDTSERTAG